MALKRKVESDVNDPQTTDESTTLALQKLEKRVKKMREDVSEILHMETVVKVYNALYITIASSPLYDARRGTSKSSIGSQPTKEAVD